MIIRFLCRTERRVLGSLTLEPGQKVNADLLRTDFVPSLDPSALPLAAGNRDGAIMLCPHCHEPVVLMLPDQTVLSAVEDNFRPVLGSFRAPEAKDKK